jgi:lysozyme family protein
MGDFDTAYVLTMSFEKGASNNPNDLGGSTGVGGLTQKEYDSFRIDQGLQPRDVSLATGDERHTIAYERFWLPANCSELLPPASIVLFDHAYNAGPSHAVKILQAVLSTKIDGAFGPATKREADRRIPTQLAHDLIAAMRGYHLKAVIDNPTQGTFLDGWIARCDALDDFVARMSIVG